MKKERQSNIELLRIIAILLIISFHYVFKSEYVFEELTINSFIIKLFYMFGELGVNIFILITGYFMINSKFSSKKLITLLIEVWFYHIISLLIVNQLGIFNYSISIEEYLSLYFPITLGKYWFITAYILLYIISPYLNLLIHNMEKKFYKKFLVIVLLIWSVIPTVIGVLFNSTETVLYYSRFVWFIIMYFVGAYIQLYSIKIFNKKSNAIIGAILSFAIMLLSILLIYVVQHNFNILTNLDVAYFWPPNTIPMFILSISIFEIFLKIKLAPNKIINKLASTTLGIYIMHDGILNSYIWKNIFSSLEHLNTKYSILYILGSTVIIFIVGAVIDLIRQLLEKHTLKKILDSKFYNQLSNELSNLSSKFLDKI